MKKLLLVSMLCLVPLSGFGAQTIDAGRLQQVLDQLHVETSADELEPAPIEGFREIVRGLQVLYVSNDGRLLIDGDVLSIEGESNLTELRRADIRRTLISGMPLDERLVAPAHGERRGKIIVFVDTNCTYCMKLHQQAAELALQGIEVQYLFYPRSGPVGDSFDQAVSVWCSDDRIAALDAVMSGAVLPAADCNNPIKRHYELARKLELQGTPAIIYADGVVRYGVPEPVMGSSLKESG